MNDTGRQIVQSMQSVREFHVSAGKLLRLATSAMGEAEWKVPPRSSACGSSTSRAVSNPRSWMPEDGFQFYRNEANPRYLAFIAVLFDDAKVPSLVSEPMATAGWLRQSQETASSPNVYQFTWCRIALLGESETKMDGIWRDVDVAPIDQRVYYQIDQARTLACPLMSIQNEADLKQQIVEPLLSELATSLSPALPPSSLQRDTAPTPDMD